MDKVSKIIKSFAFVFIALGVFFTPVYSQTIYDLSGEFTGEHIEFSSDSTNDTLVYLYKFDLTQDSNKISGKSYIYNDEGYYAVVQLRGLIIDSLVYFEEYGTLDEINPSVNHWCYTSGHLNIVKEGDKLSLIGNTKSYTKEYGGFCRDGYSSIFKIVDEDDNNLLFSEEVPKKVANVHLSPNPTGTESNLTFELNETAITIIEIYNLEGELMINALNRELQPGEYNIPIDLSFKKDGMYIVELIVDKKLYTKELWKIRF